MNKNLTIILAIVVAVAIVGVGVYAIVTSNPVSVIVNPTQGIVLETDETEVYHGETITLTATLSEGIPDQGITFFHDNISFDTVVSISGVASCTYVTSNLGDIPITVVFKATINP